MNIEPLYELKERLRTSAVAGIGLIAEDFRLKRAVEQMEPLSKAAPVFGKIYQGALHVLEVGAEQRADALLDELALLDAVLVTQAASGISGEVSAVNEGMQETVVTDAPYSKVAPALEALTTSGSGHYSFIVDMHEESPESFRDFRLRSALVRGLGAGYSELAEQIEEWLSEEDETILPFLKRGFLPDGKKEMVRRVHVVEKVAGAKENSWYLAMLDTAKKEVREALIYALRHEKANEDFLFELVKTEKSGGKKAAIWALTRMDSPKVYEYFGKQIGLEGKNRETLLVKKREKTIWEDGYFYLSKSEQISNLVAEGIHQELDYLEAQVKKGVCRLEAEEQLRIGQMLQSMVGKTSDAMIAVYKRIAGTNVFYEVKDAKEEKNGVRFYTYWNNAYRKEQYDLSYLDWLLTESILLTKSQKLYRLAAELYQEYQEVFLTSALVAALLSKEGDAVFSEFSSYLVVDEKKESAQKKAGRIAIMEVFSLLSYDETLDGYVLSEVFFDTYREKCFTVKERIYGEFDFRWLERLTDNKIKKDGDFRQRYNGVNSRVRASWDNVLERLICPKDERNCALLGTYFRERALYGKKDGFFSYFGAVRKCHMTFKPEDVILEMKQRKRMNFWEFESLIRQVPMGREDKLAVMETVRGLVAQKEIALSWYEASYLRLLDEIKRNGLDDSNSDDSNSDNSSPDNSNPDA